MSELAADGIPVAVSLRVLKLSRQPYYRWRHQQVTTAELTEAYRANALLDAHRDDPEFGYRFLVSEAAESGEVMCERTAWRICRDNQWWSVFGKKRGKNGKRPGPPVHDGSSPRKWCSDPSMRGQAVSAGRASVFTSFTGLVVRVRRQRARTSRPR